MISRPVAIIIPTYNNHAILRDCIASLLTNKVAENLFHIYVINNGHENSCDFLKRPEEIAKDVTVYDAKENLGWEGGIKKGMELSNEPYVMMLNDDTFVLQSERYWINMLLETLKYETVGAVGPASNYVLGAQSIFVNSPVQMFERKFLIGFCLLAKRAAIEEAGGIDTSLPGGDDFDLSIRLRDAGYHLVCNKNVFVYHHGSVTGNKVNSEWNNASFTEKTNHALIRKHGLKKWYEVIKNISEIPEVEYAQKAHDSEGDLIRYLIAAKDKVVYDLGCGANKTVEKAIGVDIVPLGEPIDTISGVLSQADEVADLSSAFKLQKKADVIVARHLLEHMPNPLVFIHSCYMSLRKGGKLIIAVPNGNISNFIPVNIEHLHSYTPEYLSDLLYDVGFDSITIYDPENGISFIAEATISKGEKNGK